MPYHHGDLRTALVDRAFDVVRRLGAGSVSLRAVAADVGVSPSAAYHHFPDKDSLLKAVGEGADQVFSSRLVEAAASVPGDDDAAAVDRFLALGTAYVGFSRDEPNLFRHLFSPMCSPGAGGMTTGYSQGFAALIDSIEDLGRRKLLRKGTRDGLEVLAWSSVHGAAVLALDGWLTDQAAEKLGPVLRAAIVR